MLRRIGAAATPPVTLAEAKARLRVTHDDENAVITAMIASACDQIGEMAGRVLSSETWEVMMSDFPAAVRLPKSPVIALTSVTYLDAVEAVQAAVLGDFALVQSDDWSHVQPAVGKAWPTPGVDREDAARIRFSAGYTTLPAALKEAVLLMVGHLFRNREGVSPDAMTEPPLSISALVSTHKLGWFGG